MSLSDKTIVMLNTWYPERWDPWLGIFIQRHARALAQYQPVISVYIRPAPVTETEYLWQTQGNLKEFRLYYPAYTGTFPLISPILKGFRRITAYFRAINRIQKQIPEQGIQNVLINVSGPLIWLALYFKIRFAVPVYWFEHWNGFLHRDGRYNGFWLRLQTTLLSIVKKDCAAVSELLAESLQNRGLAKNVKVIPNITDTQFLAAGKNPATVRYPLRLVHISNFVPNKQADKILKVVAELMKERQDFVVEIMGRENNEKDNLRTLSKELGISEKRIQFVPVLPAEDVAQYMQGMAGLVMYSAWETQCVVVLEAWACGIPVICTPEMGVWRLRTEKNCITADPDDLNSLKTAIRTLLNTCQTLDRKQIAKDAYGLFSPETIGKLFFEWMRGENQAKIFK